MHSPKFDALSVAATEPGFSAVTANIWSPWTALGAETYSGPRRVGEASRRTWCLHMVIALQPGHRPLEGHRPEARALEVLLECR